jgi:hypothetical protein
MDYLWTTLPPIWSECARSLIIFLWTPLSSIHWFIFHCLIADLNTACFSFLGSIVLPTTAQLFKKCRGLQCHFYEGFRRLNRCSSVFDNLPCFGIHSHISKIMSIHSLVCWNEIRDVVFWKDLLKIKLYDQRPTYVIQNIHPLIVMYFENRNWPIVRLKWLFFFFFFMVLCNHFRLWFWVHLLRVYDEVTFLWISKNKMLKSKLRFYQQKVVFLLSTYFISMHNNQ